jgi:hypothetical protein
VKKSFNIQELLHHKFKCHGTKPMHPSSSRAFQRHQEHDLKHPSLVDLITTKQNKTKQNKLPSFIDRYAGLPTKTMASHLEQSQLYWVSFDPFCDFVHTKMYTCLVHSMFPAAKKLT